MDAKAINDLAKVREELEKEKADHADTQRQWNEALDVGLKVVKERDALRNDVEVLQQYHIAGRDMNDSVTRFLDRHDNLHAGHEVVRSFMEQMRRDLPKWQAANE